MSVLQNSDIPQFLGEDRINQIFLSDDPLPCYSETQRALKDLVIIQVIISFQHGTITRKQSTPKFPKTKVSYHLIHTCTCAYQGGKKCWFFGKIDVLCFLVTSVLRFALLRHYRRIMVVNLMKNSKTGHI